MTARISVFLALCLLAWTQVASAQALRSAPRAAGLGAGGGGGGLSIPPGPTAAAPEGVRQADYIVAVVNSEPITNSDVRREVQRVLDQLAQQRQPLPDLRDLSRQVLERLINEKAQLQLARGTGIRVDEPSIDQAEQTVAAQNQMDVAQLRSLIAREGLDTKQFRDQMRDQIMLTRLRERDVEPRVRVSDLEVEQYLQEQNTANSATQLIHIAQILVAVPDDATDAQVATLKAKAEQVLARARAGEDFTALARALSDAADRTNGGQLGLRTSDRYPPVFLDAVRGLPEGGLSAVIRSGAGFHVLKLLERRTPGLPPTTVTQSRARHILLRPSAQLTEAQARDRLNDFRRRIQSGQADFETLARENSQDGSAPQGGDLGWANPGMFVPEFEAVMNRLQPGQISEPLISRFGVHLIQLLERRTAALSERDQREMVRGMLREKKLEEAFLNWARDVRGRAYVELREPPL